MAGSDADPRGLWLQGIEHLSVGAVQTGVILLSGLFFYDIFFVFFTPVMVRTCCCHMVNSHAGMFLLLLRPNEDYCPQGCSQPADQRLGEVLSRADAHQPCW